MAKNTSIISVSVPQEQANFLDEQNLSPSELIQDAIKSQMRIFNTLSQDKESLLRNIKGLQQELTLTGEFLEYISQTDAYRKWRGQMQIERKDFPRKNE